MYRRLAISVFTLAIASAVATADVTVYGFSSSDCNDSGTEVLLLTVGSTEAISLSATQLSGYCGVRIVGEETDTIGPVSLTGTRSSGSGFKVLIAGGPNWPTHPNSQISLPGAVNWAGTGDVDSSFHLVVACFVSGSVTGSVQAEQIYSIFANTLNAPIVAIGADGTIMDWRAIAFIRVQHVSSSASITSGGGGISQIFVTGSSGDGLLGDVDAVAGSIGTIFLEEKGIGSANNSIRISAYDGIDLISARSINANIKANDHGGTGGITHKIQTTGDPTAGSGWVKGSIECGGIAARSDESAPKGIQISGDQVAPIVIDGDSNQQIYISGQSQEPITVYGNVNRRISAENGFAEAIHITGDLKASVVAGTWVPNSSSHLSPILSSLTVDGSIIGRPELESEAPVFNSHALNVFISALRGTIGTISVGHNILPVGTFYEPILIRADSLGTLEVGTVGDGDCLAYLGSGQTDSFSANPDNSLQWCGGTMALTDHIDVAGLMGGRYNLQLDHNSEVHAAQGFAGSLDVTNIGGSYGSLDRRVRIGQGLTGRLVWKDVPTTSHPAPYSTLMNQVVIASEASIDDNGYTTADFNAMAVAYTANVIPESCGGSITHASISPEAQAWVPQSAMGIDDSDIGPGRVGTIPYSINVVDSYPSLSSFSLTASDFGKGIHDAIIRFNGPVYTLGSSGSSRPLKLELIKLLSGTSWYFRIPDSKFAVTMGTSDPGTREIHIHGANNYNFAAGLYRLSLNSDDGAPIVRSGGYEGGSAGPAVRPFQFWFYLESDSTTGPVDPEGECPCACSDFNQDGGVDGQDVGAFFETWQTGDTSADVNQDGGVDGSDVEFFFICWESGSICELP